MGFQKRVGKGCALDWKMGLTRLVLELDNKEVVEMLRSRGENTIDSEPCVSNSTISGQKLECRDTTCL